MRDGPDALRDPVRASVHSPVQREPLCLFVGTRSNSPPWLASKVIMDGCADRDVTYLGGLLSTNPNICLTLHVADATGEAQDVGVGSTGNCSCVPAVRW